MRQSLYYGTTLCKFFVSWLQRAKLMQVGVFEQEPKPQLDRGAPVQPIMGLFGPAGEGKLRG